MLMAGASAVGICTAPILKGVEYITKLNASLEALLKRLSYDSVAAASGVSLPFLRKADEGSQFDFAFDPVLCTKCMLCVKACAYDSRALANGAMSVDDSCRHCGLCASVCPAGSLRLTWPIKEYR